MAERERGWVWYAAQDPARQGKLSVLACTEIILSIATYWWIAVTWQTHLHLLVAVIAAPLVLLRSDASVAAAQEMWDSYLYRDNRFPFKKIKGVLIITITVLSIFTATPFLVENFLFIQNDKFSIFNILIVLWIILNIIFSILLASAYTQDTSASIATTGSVERSLRIARLAKGTGAILFPGIFIGLWCRSISIRIVSVLKNFRHGVHKFISNWYRVILSEDSSHTPELLPDVYQKNTFFRLHGRLEEIRRANLTDKIIAILVIIFLFLPSLLWRYSLKSTCWFYAPLIYVATPTKFADPVHRRLMIDRSPPLLEIGRFVFALIALTVAAIALVDWSFWRDLVKATEVFSPVGWVLVLDWGKIWDQPWQIPALLSGALTIGIFLWIDSLRRTRKQLIEQGQDPETAADNAYSTEQHPGLTLYWLNRLRTVFVTVSLLIGGWYFLKGSYEAGLLTTIEPFLSTIFGPR